jgi:Predicted hydrolase of the HD superfamily (permuted catalytic motifs)
MSLQVFLQAQLLGSESFLSSSFSGSDPFAELLGRCGWLSLICEVLPRALLAEMKLSRMLLGSSGGEQFLLVLTDDSLNAANEFLTRAAGALSQISGGKLQLVWSSTENLGPWPIVRKRLDEEMLARTATPLATANSGADWFAPVEPSEPAEHVDYFAAFGEKLVTAGQIGWSSDRPARLECDGGDFTWPLRDQMSPDEDSIVYPRRFAGNDEQERASLEDVARTADGAPRWAILRGDVDHFEARLRQANSVEEHIQLSVLFKEFFVGELALLCTLPEFWRKVSILYRGGDDFAVIGSWDALVALAREMQRVFDKFAAQNLQSFAGVEGKTISMSLAIAPSLEASPITSFEEAGQQLQAAKATELGTFHLFGRSLEWKRLADAEELKNGLLRLINDFGHSADYIHDLASVYREAYSAQATRRAKAIRVDKPWRTYMRLSQVIPVSRGPVSRVREWNNLRNSLIANLVGKKTANLKLRPSGRVGLEWARLAAGNE